MLHTGNIGRWQHTIIFGYEIPNILIKVSEKHEYLEALSQGQVYMKESGYFRKLEDNYRGDPYDGKRPVVPMSNDYILIGDPNSSMGQIRIDASHIIKMEFGFEGDDKIPLFCCSLLSEEIAERKGKYEFGLEPEFISKMSEFGKYAMIFRLSELAQGLLSYANTNLLELIAHPVSYVVISKEYGGSSSAGMYSAFFKKDIKYQGQNEWRALLSKPASPLISPTPWTPLIGADEDHLIATIPPFKQYNIVTISELEKQVFQIKGDDT